MDKYNGICLQFDKKKTYILRSMVLVGVIPKAFLVWTENKAVRTLNVSTLHMFCLYMFFHIGLNPSLIAADNTLIRFEASFLYSVSR